MHELSLFLSNNWLTLVLFVISTILAILLFVFGIRRKRISIYHTTTQIYSKVANKVHDSLKITFDGLVVDKVYQTKLYLWNSGNQTIDKDDIIEPLSIEIPKGKILDIALMPVSREQCKISYDPIDLQKSNISFSFLDKNDGSCLKILHTDTLKMNDFTIKGTKQKNCKDISLHNLSSLKHKIGLNIVNLILTLLICGFDYLIVLSSILIFNNIKNYEVISLVMFSIMLIFIAVLSYFFFTAYLPSQYLNKIPKSLRGEK